MARPLRIEYPGAVYHVTCRGNARKGIFLVDPDRELFLKVLAKVVERFNGCSGSRLVLPHSLRQLPGFWETPASPKHAKTLDR